MFDCEFCPRTFTRKDNLKRHGDCRTTTRKCLQCSGVFKTDGALERHLKKSHQVPKRKTEETSQVPVAKKTMFDQRNQPATSNTRLCTNCDIEVPSSRWIAHLQSLQHIANSCVEEANIQLIKTSHQVPKRKTEETSQVPVAKKVRLDQDNQPATSTTRLCTNCDMEVPSSRWIAHLRSLQHIANSCVAQEEANVQLIKTSFRNRIATYRLTSSRDSTNAKRFVANLREKIGQLVEKNLGTFGNLKVGVELFGRFLLQTKEIAETKSFNTRFQLVGEGTDLEELFDQFAVILERKLSEFQEKDSGWALQQLLHLDLSINKVNPLKASSYIKLPKDIESKKAVLNIQNHDNKCFMWSILASLHPIDRTQHANRTANYSPFEDELDFSGMEFPIQLKDISKFENLNNISINVYGLENVFKNDRNAIKIVGP